MPACRSSAGTLMCYAVKEMKPNNLLNTAQGRGPTNCRPPCPIRVRGSGGGAVDPSP